MLRNTDDRYGLPAMALHWIMAALMIGLFAFGLWMDELPKNDFRVSMFGLHKSLGVLVLLLVAVRLAWRAVNPAPRPVAGPLWQQLAAHGAHLALYGLMIAIPLAGWLMSSAAGKPVSLFGLVTLPPLIGQDKPLKETFEEVHSALAFAMIGLVFIHAAAAVWHQRIRKDGVLARMLPLAR